MKKMIGYKRVYGIADYSAVRMSRSNLVKLRAVGVLPCFNYEAALEKRPEKIFPPMWDLVFYVADSCWKAFRFFELEATMNIAPDEGDSIIVHDATGEVSVPIVDQIAGAKETEVLLGGDSYCVFALLPKGDAPYSGCVVVPEGSLLPGVYYHVYGPGSRSDCDVFIHENCGADIKLRAGEIPWPLAI